MRSLLNVRTLVCLLAIAAFAACGGSSSRSGSRPLASEEPLALRTPSDGGAANVASPSLRWNAFEGATRYRVSGWADEERTTPLLLAEPADPAFDVRAELEDGSRVWLDIEAIDASDRVLATRESRFKVVRIPDAFPDFEPVVFDERRSAGGYTLLNLQDPLPPDARERVAALVLINRAGEVVWWHQRPRGFITDARALENGNLLMIYRPDLTEPLAIEMTWEQVDVWTSREGALPHHEVGIGPDGHYLYLTALARDVRGQTFEGDGLELVDPATDEVLWRWDIFDHVSTDEVDPIDIQLPGLTGLGLDWTHSNAAVWDEARSLIWVSVRNLDRMLAVDYPSGAVRGVIGEGGLGGVGFMDHQHAPEVQGDGSILYFDNGGRNVPQFSRVAQFEWDEGRATVRETFEWRDEPDFFDGSVGDADRLPNGNILVTSGTAGLFPPKNARLIEITSDGEIVWDMRLGGAFRLLGFWIYRAQQLNADQLPPRILPFAPGT